MKPRWLIPAVAIVACGSKHDPEAYDHAAAKGVFDVVHLAADTPPGLSDLALDARGVAWTIPERDRFVVEIPAITVGAAPLPTKQHALAGIPDDHDTEALAWLDPTHLALGLEGQDTPTARLAIATYDPAAGTFAVTGTLVLDTLPLGVKLKNNHGVEGLCGNGDRLLVAIEETGKLGKDRFAPIVAVSGASGPIAAAKTTILKLALSTDVGKISALACTIDPATGAAHVGAIERHFGVSRIVTFEVPPNAPDGAVLHETLVLDLAPILKDSLNLEGIATLPDGHVALIADNQSKTVEGPDTMLVLAPSIRIAR